MFKVMFIILGFKDFLEFFDQCKSNDIMIQERQCKTLDKDKKTSFRF